MRNRVAALGMFVATTAAANPALESLLLSMNGTLSVTSQPLMSEGRLAGCTLVFDAIQQDWTYRSGAFLKVTGNIGVVSAGDRIGTNLKVVVHEIDASGNELLFKPSPPSRAYLIDRMFVTNLDSLVKATESDTPGALFSIFQLSPTLDMVLAAVEQNGITVAFNSRNGATDIQLPLELDVVDVSEAGERKRSGEHKAQFLGCVYKLLE